MLIEDPSVVKVTTAAAHLFHRSKPPTRFDKFIPPHHTPCLIRALRPAVKDQSLALPEEPAIESLANNRHFIGKAAFPHMLYRFAAGLHVDLKAAFPIAVVDPQK